MQGIIKTSHTSSLAHVVCAWQPSKLSELAKAFSDSCSPPEASFSGYDSYKAYFEPLLFAEITAELLSAIDKYQRTAVLRNPKVRAKREESATTVASVTVQRVTKVHSLGFGWTVDVDSNDRRGPVGCVDNDVVMLWSPERRNPNEISRKAATPRQISSNAILAVVARPLNRTGCRLVMSKFPDGNERGVRVDLEEGEEDEEQAPSARVWFVLRIGSLTTMKREFDALQQIKTSPLLPTLLRPKVLSTRGQDDGRPVPKSQEGSSKEKKALQDVSESQRPKFRNEHAFTNVVSQKTGLNASQARAIMHASTCQAGFSVIQGPPGTGKTRTLIALLNVIHMTQYHEYYEGLLTSLNPISERGESAAVVDVDAKTAVSEKGSDGSLLQSMMVAMNKTVATASDNTKSVRNTKRACRPRLLICAPSNSAVDEVLTRLTRSKFVDGQGREYCPELARIGNGDRVSEAAKPFTAEGQAETFLDRLCAEDMTPEAQKKAQMGFLKTWQNRCNVLLVQLERTPKKLPSSRPTILDLHEKLERMDRDLRRLSIAASDGASRLTREEKLRQIARTYVEDAQLVFATLSGSASSILTKKGKNDISDSDGTLFDTVVIDEGAQATETSCLIPMTLGAKRCLLVGDPQQLPATVLSSGAAGLAYGQSLLERVCRGGQNVQLLDTQYRMHPAISSFPRRYFYNGRLVDDESVQGENRARPYHRDAVRPKLGPYVFLDIAEGEERRSRDDRSIFNSAEAELASLIYTKLKKEYSKDQLFSPAAKVHGSVTGFGVVTPYKRQMQELRQSFDRAGIPTGDVEIDTVDSFQGREKDVIVFSCVRTASVNHGIGFVRDVRRMNVGLTRARVSLIVLGSAQALSEGSSDWAELIEDASSRGCLISVSNVSRCLAPPRHMTARRKSETKISAVVAGAQMSASREIESSLGEKPGAVVNPGLPGDPRHRATNRERTAVLSSVQQHAGDGSKTGDFPTVAALRSQLLSNPGGDQIHISGNFGSENAELSHAAISAGLVSGNQAVQNGSNSATTAVETKSALQTTLDQMTRLLSDAGFQNTEALESSLKEHVGAGGALDLETVMAAAIAANSTMSKQVSTTAMQKSASPASDPRQRVKTEVGVQRGTPNEDDSTDGKTKSSGVDGKRARGDEVKKEVRLSAERRDSLSLKDKDPRKKAKVESKEVKSQRSAKSKMPQTPSGWDMLFSSTSGPQADRPGSRQPENGASEVPGERQNIVSVGEASKVGQPNLELSAADEVQRTAKGNGHTEMKHSRDDVTEASHVLLEPDGGPKRSSAKDYSQLGKDKFKKSKHERNREIDRKRGRLSEFGRGGGGGGRGPRSLERGRSRPKRGRSLGHAASTQDSSATDGFQGGDSWPPSNFDVPMAPFPAVGAVMDPGIAGPHPINQLHAMQQQAMQQQLMQQQVFQQQAMQQQAFQHQALQHQAMQHQALQQEALRQQALFMQMNASGVAPMAPPNSFPSSDFSSQNPAPHGNSRFPERGTGPWVPGNPPNRSRGRGRGRAKHSGRGRRNG